MSYTELRTSSAPYGTSLKPKHFTRPMSCMKETSRPRTMTAKQHYRESIETIKVIECYSDQRLLQSVKCMKASVSISSATLDTNVGTRGLPQTSNYPRKADCSPPSLSAGLQHALWPSRPLNPGLHRTPAFSLVQNEHHRTWLPRDERIHH